MQPTALLAKAPGEHKDLVERYRASICAGRDLLSPAADAQFVRQREALSMSRVLSTEEVAAVQDIQSVHDAWIAAELAGDIEAVLRLCTADVRWLTPGSGEAVGPAAGRRLLSIASVQLEDIRATDIRIEVSGDLA